MIDNDVYATGLNIPAQDSGSTKFDVTPSGGDIDGIVANMAGSIDGNGIILCTLKIASKL